MNTIESVGVTLHAFSVSDIRGTLHDDHRVLLNLARRLADAERAPSRKALVRELRPLLVAHSRAEEAAVYRPLMNLRNSPASRMAGNEGMVEHNLADIVLDRLANTSDATSDMWRAHAKVLCELLHHHIGEEENGVFVDLGTHFSDDDRAHMSVDFATRRCTLLAQKSHRSPASPVSAHKTRLRQIA